jgi:hypothetical protein
MNLLFGAAFVMAFNEAGHMVSGSLAYAVMSEESPEVLSRVVAILKKHPLYDGWKRKLDEIPAGDRDHFLLMLAARWPDDIRGNKKYNHPEWHYVDFPWRSNGQPESLVLKEPKTENALTAMKENLDLLEKDIPEDEKAVALCWVLHLTGDIHQPLHTISKFTKEMPEGDAGGTRVSIIPPGFEKPLLLHFYWDDLILNNDCFDMASNRSLELRQRPEFSKEYLTELSETDYRNWAKKESFELAKKYVYLDGKLAVGTDRSQAPSLPDDYAVVAKRVAERQIVLSGYRIAELMNRAFGKHASP